MLERIVGRGGFGIVFAARDELLGRRVAIKVTRGEPTPAVLDRFEHEAKIAARLNHPSLVTLHDSGTIEGLPYLVLELLEGETLAVRLGRKRLDENESLRVISDLLGAVAKMHAAGIVHLDLKPSNVFLTTDGRVKVLDFGLAKLRDVTSPGGGTRGYMAPEQMVGEPDARSDVYSVGVMLLELVFGEMRDISAMKLAPMRLRPVLARALARDPDHRYGDAAAMLAAINAVRVPDRKKRRVAVAATGAAALAVAIAAPLAVMRWDRAVAVDAATMAERAGREAAAIEAQLRYARLQPLHDIRGEEAHAKLDLAVLGAEIGGGGDEIGDAAQVALARAERAVHDLPGARERLERVMTRAHTPAAMQALGDVLLDQYNEAMMSLWYVSDHEASIAHEQQLATTLRDEGLKYLVDSKPSDPLTLARIAIFERRMPEGVKLANDALLADPGLYEAHYVLGGAYAELASSEGKAGKHDEALADFQKANREFEAGSAIARSSPELHDGACRALQLELDDRQHSPDAGTIYTTARASCARALVTRPGDIVSTVVIAYLDQVRSASMMERGEDPQPVLQDGFALLGAALAIDPNNFSLLDARGVLSLMAANADVQRDRDPRPNLAVAEQSFTSTNALVPDTHAEDMLGQIAAMRAEDTLSRGGDPRTFAAHAVELLQHGDSTHRQVFAGRALVARASWETQHDIDPEAALDAAVAAFQKARATSPHNMAAVDEEGGAWQAKAEWEAKRGVDNIASLDKAIACSEVVLAADADDLEGHANLGGVLVMRAEAEIARHGDARPFLEQALAHLDRAHAIDKSAEGVKTSIASALKLMAQLEQKK